MSHFSGPGRFGDGDDDDDDDDGRRIPGQGEPESGRSPLGGGPERQFTYYSEDRYWTDYLRIAVPVVGVILMLGLVWFWLSSILGGDDNTDPTPSGANNPVVTGSPTSGAGAVGSPTPLQTATSAANATPGTGQFAVGDKVVVTGTGGTGVNLRDKPSTDGTAIDTLDDGTELEITGPSEEGDNYTWWPVKYNDETGYIAGDFLKASQ